MQVISPRRRFCWRILDPLNYLSVLSALPMLDTARAPAKVRAKILVFMLSSLSCWWRAIPPGAKRFVAHH